MELQDAALVNLGRELLARNYHFTAITPASHLRVISRAQSTAPALQRVFGWSLPFRAGELPEKVFQLLEKAGEVETDGDLIRSKVRFSSLAEQLFVHSAFPTEAPDSVFFGPDTYRFVRVLRHAMANIDCGAAFTVIDVGCGSGAGGICAAALLRGRAEPDVILSDINPKAVRYSRINASLNGIGGVRAVLSDVLQNINESGNIIISNPPYLTDRSRRLYRHGGGEVGFDLSIRIVQESLNRLRPGGRLVLYTGSAIVNGEDAFFAALRPHLEASNCTFFYEEIDPDVLRGGARRRPLRSCRPHCSGGAHCECLKENVVSPTDFAWTRYASQLEGERFAIFQREFAKFNAKRLNPSLPLTGWRDDLEAQSRMAEAEREFVEAVRAKIAPLASSIPHAVNAFIAWFEWLREEGPGQGDPLFPWLERSADRRQMRWFIEQEVAGEAGFDDLLALTQVKMPETAKLEMARNYWDEMGRGTSKGMHGPMLECLARHLEVHPTPDNVIPEALALGNMMVALAHNRRYAFHSVGALGVIEMTAPARAGYVARGLQRLGIPPKKRHYFALHAVLDIKHSEAWNREVLRTLVAEDPRRAQAIGEGAILRLWHGARCFDRYRERFNVPVRNARAA